MSQTSVSHSTGSVTPLPPYSYPVQRPGSAVSSRAVTGQKKIRLKVEASKLPKPLGKVRAKGEASKTPKSRGKPKKS